MGIITVALKGASMIAQASAQDTAKKLVGTTGRVVSYLDTFTHENLTAAQAAQLQIDMAKKQEQSRTLGVASAIGAALTLGTIFYLKK
jgi:hypothetical protein